MEATRSIRVEDSGGLGPLLMRDPQSLEAWEQTAFDEEIAFSGRRVVLFGSGSVGRRAAECLRIDGIEPLCFADNSPLRWGTDIDRIPVLSPADAARSHGTDATFVVTIWNERHRYAETRKQLADLGCASVIPSNKLRWKYSRVFLPFFFDDLPHHVYRDADAVKAAAGLWADDFSYREYIAQVRLRALGDMESLAAPDVGETYFPTELFSLVADECFVDCGAFDGSTAKSFLKRSAGVFKRYIALEPDPISHDRLCQYVSGLEPRLRERTTVLPLAAADRRKAVRFRGTGEVTSTISDDGEVTVECAPLDELLSAEAPTFIKMDIEGSEADALAGARGIIVRHRPILAVCLYHRVADLWRLPLLINDVFGGYRLHLRAHDCDGWQTVCYAVPAERSLI
jgi:FkbM family methyltransferase